MNKTLLVWISLICAGLGGVLYGYDIGVISGALVFIKQSILLTRQETEIIVGSVLIGGLLGTVFTGSLADRFGRRTMILVACIIFAIGLFFILISTSFLTLLFARLLLGIGVGIIAVAVPLYLTETAPAKLRGRAVTLFQIFLTLGILLAYIVDKLFTGSGDWRSMFSMIYIPTAILFVSMLVLPETPRWLVVHKRLARAREVIRKFHGEEHIEREINAIQKCGQRTKNHWRTLLQPSYFPALLLAIFIAVSNQLTGVNIILQYAPTVIQSSGMSSEQTTMIATVGIGAVQFVFTLIALALIDIVGRKLLLCIGTLGLVFCDLYLAMVSHIYPVGYSQAIHSVYGLLAYILFYGIGPGVVVWLVISESLPTKVRGKAISTCLFFNSLTAALLSSVFLTVSHAIGMTATYSLFAFFSLLYFLSAYFLLAETKGKSLEAIQQNLEAKRDEGMVMANSLD